MATIKLVTTADVSKTEFKRVYEKISTNIAGSPNSQIPQDFVLNLCNVVFITQRPHIQVLTVKSVYLTFADPDNPSFVLYVNTIEVDSSQSDGKLANYKLFYRMSRTELGPITPIEDM
jgi:hypothetical protein